MLGSLLTGGAVICASLLLSPFKKVNQEMKNQFVLAETDRPVSFDPLSADYSNNLHASQMLHRAILDVGSDNTLHSTVLKSFSYDPGQAKITFVVSDSAKFSDGSPITGSDVAATITRMLLKRPQFPVLRHIVGLSEWLTKAHPLEELPRGIQIAANEVRVSLLRNVNTPLFRFALPLFGVIKSECLDRQKNEMKPHCPTSGFYRLSGINEADHHFELNEAAKTENPGLPQNITLRYLNHSVQQADLIALKDGAIVIQLMDYRREQSFGGEAGFARVEQPNSRFSVFLLNPNSNLFGEAGCRRAFAERLRSNLQNENSQSEASLFSRILPGFLTSSQLQSADPLSKSTIQNCESHFERKTIRWMRGTTNATIDFEAALSKTAEQLKLRLEIADEKSPRERYDAFVAGQLDITLGGSGFWAFDPVGDVQMLLTPNLHKPLKFIAQDPKLQAMLNGLEFESDPNPRLQQINRYVYEQALMNVYAHSKRIYLVKNVSNAGNIPVAITPPAPWQVFNGNGD